MHFHFFLAAASFKRYSLSEYPTQSNSKLFRHREHIIVFFGSTLRLHLEHVTCSAILRSLLVRFKLGFVILAMKIYTMRLIQQ